MIIGAVLLIRGELAGRIGRSTGSGRAGSPGLSDIICPCRGALCGSVRGGMLNDRDYKGKE
jgi:hypothetical protein